MKGEQDIHRDLNTSEASKSTGPYELMTPVIETLLELVESCRDGDFGFTTCAEYTDSPRLKTLFYQRAQQCRDAAVEIGDHLLQLGATPTNHGSARGALHRGWVAVRGTLSGHSEQAMLDECERAEDMALGAYRKALKQTLPQAIEELLRRQRDLVQRNHDEIKALRDELRSHA